MPSWSWLDDHNWDETITCQSVGWLIHDGEETKALAPNSGRHCDSWQVSGVIRIPTKAVLKIKKLKGWAE